MAIGSANLRRRGRNQLQVELSEVGPRPVDLVHPLGDPLLAGRRERVHLALGAIRRGPPRFGRNEACLLEAPQSDVDLAGVDLVAEGTQSVVEAGSQLVTVRRLLGQHRQHDFLLHAGSVHGVDNS